MSTVQLPDTTWKFYQHAIVPNHGRNADFEKTSGKSGESVYIFKFPYSGRQVKITLKWDPSDSSHQTLTGTYTWEATRQGNHIEFHVLKNGTVLEGIPEGINGLRTWILVSDQQSSVSSDSGCIIS